MGLRTDSARPQRVSALWGREPGEFNRESDFQKSACNVAECIGNCLKFMGTPEFFAYCNICLLEVEVSICVAP